MSTPLERLFAETIPTRPPPAPKAAAEPWTPEEQARHLADLAEATRGWHWEDDTRISAKRRHLRVVRNAPAA